MATTDQLNVQVAGCVHAQPMVFVQAVGCDRHTWREVIPAFDTDHQVVTFDLVGAGGADPSAWDPGRCVTLEAYAEDILTVVNGLDLHRVVLVGHSVSAMSALLAVVSAPDRFAGLVIVGPSPRYSDDGDGDGDGCNALSQVTVPTLVVQSREDVIAPLEVGQYVADSVPGARLALIETTGHCPQLSAAGDTIAAIRDFLAPGALAQQRERTAATRVLQVNHRRELAG